MGHRVKVYNWVKGELHSKEYFFKEAKAAVNFADSAEDHTVKIYDENDDLIRHLESKKLVMPSDE